MRLGDVVGVEHPAAWTCEQGGSDAFAEEVADLVADDCCPERDCDCGHESAWKFVAAGVGCEEPGKEQQGVPGQEEAEQQAALGEDDHREDGESAVTDPVVGEVEHGEHQATGWAMRAPGQEWSHD